LLATTEAVARDSHDVWAIRELQCTASVLLPGFGAIA